MTKHFKIIHNNEVIMVIKSSLKEAKELIQHLLGDVDAKIEEISEQEYNKLINESTNQGK